MFLLQTCLPCHSECDGCTGGSNKDCNSCKSLTVLDEETNTVRYFPIFRMIMLDQQKSCEHNHY